MFIIQVSIFLSIEYQYPFGEENTTRNKFKSK